MSDHIEIGILGRPHGIKGEIRVTYFAESPDLLRGPLFLKNGNRDITPVTISTLRFIDGTPLIIIQGADDRTSAERLRGCSLLVRRSDLPEPLPDEPYLEDLVGCTVIDDDTNKTVGVLSHFLFTTDPEVWSIRTPSSGEFLFPAASKFIRGYDMQARTIRIAPPEGLYGIYGITL